jgi:hypothetical protein
MNTVNLLLGNSDRRINNLLEIAVRDVCYNLAVVNCYQTSRVDELLRLGSSRRFGLIFIAPQHLKPEPSRRPQVVSMGEVLQTIRILRARCTTPMIAVAVTEEEELGLLEAGAENTFPLFFNVDLLKAEVRRVLRFPELKPDQTESEGGLIESFLRRFRS